MAAIESVMLGREERWIQHYCSGHSILLVGEGDFSFSLCLAMAFGSATNIVATSLDSYDQLIQKYKNAKINLRLLEILGASLLHGVDATRMEMLTDLRCRKFHRIIYNFPHAGFHSKEDDPALINMHRSLVFGFFRNARMMLMVDGEIHLNHKVTSPYNEWRIEDLASECALFLVECPVFSINDYPGYENKRGAGYRCDMPFPLGKCRTFKFKKLNLAAEKILRHAEFQEVPILEQHQPLPLRRLHPLAMSQEVPILEQHQPPPLKRLHPLAKFQEVPILEQHQPPPLERLHPLGYDHSPLRITQTSNIRISNECHEVFGRYPKYVEETFGGTSHALCEAIQTGFRTYICSVPGGTWSGYIGFLKERHNRNSHNRNILRSECLRQMLANTC